MMSLATKNNPLRAVLRFFSCAACLSSSLFLGGCLNNVFGPEKPLYSLSFNSPEESPEQKQVEDYLNSILLNRVNTAPDIDPDTPDAPEQRAYLRGNITLALQKAMQAKGYYDAQVSYRPLVDITDINARHANSRPSRDQGEFQISSGPLYTISGVEIIPAAFSGRLNAPDIAAGKPLDAATILRAQKDLYEAIQKDHCYYRLSVTHEALAGAPEKSAFITYKIETGAEAKLARPTFQGQKSVKLSYLNKLVPWEEGACFKQDKIETLKSKFLETGLFSSVKSALPDQPDENGLVTPEIILQERTHRRISAGASYYSDEGAGATLSWSHINFLGAAENFKAALNLSQIKRSLSTDFTKPFFLHPNQELNLNATVTQQDTDAYDETSIDFSGRLKRKVGRHWKLSTGAKISISRIEDQESTKNYGLISLPNSLVFDTRDKALDPHRGSLLNVTAEPFFDAFGESDPFTKIEAGARHYFAFGTKRDIILALRANSGSLIGASSGSTPATERFYAGGGGSVRGYGYQEVGPFQDRKPEGGRSFTTGSTELRMKFTQNIGAVAFIDAGSVSEKTFPDMDNLAIGAGVGARYYTGFGPIRFDLAVPLTEKKNIDQNYQFYISIGQAF